MKEYNYVFVDVKMKIGIPLEISVEGKMKNFLCLEETKTHESEEVVFEEAEKLPQIPEDGIWYQEHYFTRFHNQDAVYLRALPTSEPYALVVYGKNFKTSCYYLSNEKSLVPESDYLLNVLGLEKILLRHKALILHASFICFEGNGILFSAPSGIGKSTQADLWKQYMNAEIINGDRAGLRKKDGVWHAYGLPYAGSSRIYKNESAPLKAIVVLEQGSENVIKELNQMEAMHHLLPEFSLQRWDEHFMQKALDQIIEILNEIPVYLFTCRPDKDAVKLLHDTIRNEEKR